MGQNKTKPQLELELQEAKEHIERLELALKQSEFSNKKSISLTKHLETGVRLRTSEEYYRVLIGALDISLCRWLPDTTLTYANEKYKNIFGKHNDIIGQKWLDFLPEETRESTAAFYSDLAKDPRTVNYEHAVTTEDGDSREYQWIDTPIFDENGKLSEFQSIGIDITERKRAEGLVIIQRDLARLTGANLPEKKLWDTCLRSALQVSSLDSGSIHFFNEDNRAFELIHYEGFSEEFIKVMARFTEDTPSAKNILSGKSLFLTNADLNEQSFYNAEGIRSFVSLPILHHGRILGCIHLASHTLSNIPDHVHGPLETLTVEIGNLLVHQRTEESLQTSREQLSHTLTAAKMGVWRWYVPTNKMEWSSEAAALFGVEPGQSDVNSILERFHPEDRARVVTTIQEAFSQKKLLSLEFRIFDVSGNVHWIVNYGNIEYGEDGNPLAVAGLIQDITPRKQAEQAQREIESQYRLLFETMVQGVVFQNADGQIIQSNQAAEQILGLTSEQIQGRSSIDPRWNPIHEDGTKFPGETHPAMVALQTGQPVHNVVMGIHNPTLNSYRWININATPRFREGDTRPYQVYTTFEDITERKQAQEEFRNAEMRYRALIENAPDGIVLIETTGKFKYVSSSVTRIFGYTQEDIPDCDANQMTHPEDLPLVMGELTKLLEDPTYIPTLQYRFRHKNGEWRWIESTFSNLLSIPNVEAIIINFRDVHERKLTEGELSKSQNLLKEAQRIGRIGHMEWRGKGQELICSDELYDIFELPKGTSVSQDTIANMMPSGELERIQKLDYQSFKQRADLDYEYSIQTKDGSERWLHQIGKMTYDENGVPLRMMSIVQDVTQRKITEIALRESEERFRSLFQSSNAIMLLIEPDSGKIVDANQAASKFYGYTHEQFISMNIVEINQLPPYEVLSERLKAKREERNYFIFPHRLSNGQIRTVEVRSHPIVSEKQTLLFSIIYDITESTQNQEKLHNSQMRMEMAIKGANAGTWEWNILTDEMVFNERWAEIVGYALSDLEPANNETWIKLCHPEDLKRSDELLKKHFTGESEYYNCEVRLKHKSGAWVWVIDSGKVMEWDPEGRPLRMFGTHLDITEQKREESYTQARLNLANQSHQIQDIDSLMRTMLDEAEALTNSKIGFFHFVENNQNTIKLHIWSSNTLNMLCSVEGAKQHYPVSEAGIWADSIRNGGAVIYNDYASLPHQHELPNGHAPLTRLISLPIKRNNLVVGVIGVGNKSWDYDENDLGIVKRLAEDAFDLILRKRAEIELQSSVEKYRGLMESLDSVVVTVDYSGKILYLNDVAAKQIGRPAGDLVDKMMWEIFPQGYADHEMELIRKVIRDDHAAIRETKISIQGELRWYRSSYQPIHNESGEVSQVLVNATDIDNLKKVQQELQDLNRTLEEKVSQRTAEVQDLYENAPTGYHSLDVNGRFIAINQTELNWLGYSRDEMLGHSFSEFITNQSAEHFKYTFPALKREGKVIDIEFEMRRKDNSTFPVLLNAVAIQDEQGNYIRSRSTIFDNTERKKAEDALRESYDRLTIVNIELEKAMRVKDEFLASMSHELRTPLTGILGLSEALQLNTYGELSAKQQKTIKSIEDSGRHLLDLINDILDLSKIEAGKLEIQTSICLLTDICQASLQLTKGMAHQKHQQVQYSAPVDPILLNVDPRRIKQIIVNLLSNAIKFTPEDGELGLEIEPDKIKQQVRLIVWDKGIGIKQENISKLFRPFTQIDSSLAREYTGTGLGLSLVRELAEIHDGSVEVESVFGDGSRFIVTLPWAQQTAQDNSSEQNQNELFPVDTTEKKTHEGLVLITDDNQLLLDMIADFLESYKYQTAKMNSGKDLLAKISEYRPDLILMDIQMPGMDGFETIQHVRSHADVWIASTPIIAVTALAMPGDRDRCLAAGANEYISKPVNLKELIKVVQSHIKLGRKI